MTILSRFVIHGHSMEPTIKACQVVVVSSIPFLFRTPKVGDIIAFKSPQENKILIKRITSIENNKYFVQGDNHSDSTDSRKFGMITRDQILGKFIC